MYVYSPYRSRNDIQQWVDTGFWPGGGSPLRYADDVDVNVDRWAYYKENKNRNGMKQKADYIQV